ncbi:MAG: response regulator transcription factor [Woeseia sp.]
MQILLIEDDLSLASGLSKALARESFSVNHVTRGEAALHVMATEPPEIVVLDLGLPDMDGLQVLRKIRHSGSQVPILVLTARSSIDARVTGLDLGADDYLPKPFEIDELVARLRVIERRLSTTTASRIEILNVALDTLRQQVFVDDQQIDLPRREYALLKILMENEGKVQTREHLETRLYAWGDEIASNSIEVHIHHLRKKLGSDFIKTIRGVGYVVRHS